MGNSAQVQINSRKQNRIRPYVSALVLFLAFAVGVTSYSEESYAQYNYAPNPNGNYAPPEDETDENSEISDEISTTQAQRKRRKRKSSTRSRSSSSSSISKYKRKRKKVRRRRSKGNIVNLDELEDTSATPLSRSSYSSGDSAPNFKVFFDILLDWLPGKDPDAISFTSYHTLFLVDYTPRPEVTFSFEVNPNPRYYELKLDLTERLQLRVGRIWIPFDNIDPHNQFGGWLNTTELLPNGGTAFLPNIWAELGVAGKYRLVDTTPLGLDAHLYVTNGFGGGATDPTGGTNDYPNFAGPTATTFARDNNGDKAIGARVQATFFRRIAAGASFYTAKWTDSGVDPSGRITMVGIDSHIRLANFDIRTGWLGARVTLPEDAGNFIRGGLYAEGSMQIAEQWKTTLRFGVAQNDNRVIDVTDRTLAGFILAYNAQMFTIGLEHFRDLNQSVTKEFVHFYGLRFSILL